LGDHSHKREPVLKKANGWENNWELARKGIHLGDIGVFGGVNVARCGEVKKTG